MSTASHIGDIRKRRFASRRDRHSLAEPRDLLLGVVAPALLLCGWALDAAVSSSLVPPAQNARMLAAAHVAPARTAPLSRSRKVYSRIMPAIGTAKARL